MADPRLQSRAGKDHDGEGLPGNRAGGDVAPEGHQVQVDRVEHQLDPHQDRHRVPASQHAIQADGEEGCRKDEEPGKRDHSSPSSRAAGLAMTMAPIIAASSSTEATSNGST